jgi:hypothetical protein
MQHLPDHFLEQESKDKRSDSIKSLEEYIHRLTFELAKNTGEISVCVIPEKSICEYS